MTVIRTELDALLDRVREDKADTTGKNRNAVAYDCWRMFEDLATRYKEEFAMRDRYKRQSDAWRDKAFELADETEIAKLKIEAACPCCRGASILQPCQECRGSKLASVAYDTLRVHYKLLQESIQWKPIETAPKDTSLLLWWTPRDGNPYAEACVIGGINSYTPGTWWNGQTGTYQELERVTHWMELPGRPESLTLQTSGVVAKEKEGEISR